MPVGLSLWRTDNSLSTEMHQNAVERLMKLAAQGDAPIPSLSITA
jgi:uncharacterized protein YoaH (UPF0181 family)